MFIHSAPFYDALYSFKDYGAAVAELKRVLAEEAPDAKTLLDVGCGTGRHLELLAEDYEVEGLDLNPKMLDVARERNPGVELHEADMTEFSLGKRFDVVTCLFSSIAYVRTADRMREATRRLCEHLNPGGVVVLEPWFPPDSYWTGTITANFVDQPDLKIAWMYTSEREDLLSVLDIHYLVGRPEAVERFEERHEMGLFTQDEHLEAFRAAGLEARYSEGGPFGRGLYVAR